MAFLTRSVGLDLEGIFRISASKRDLEHIQFLIDEGMLFEAFYFLRFSGENVDFSQCDDKHLVPGLLKKYFRDLPESLFTEEFHNCFLFVYQSRRKSLLLVSY